MSIEKKATVRNFAYYVGDKLGWNVNVLLFFNLRATINHCIQIYNSEGSFMKLFLWLMEKTVTC